MQRACGTFDVFHSAVIKEKLAVFLGIYHIEMHCGLSLYNFHSWREVWFGLEGEVNPSFRIQTEHRGGPAPSRLCYHTVLFSSEYSRFPSGPPPIAQVPRKSDRRFGGIASISS